MGVNLSDLFHKDSYSAGTQAKSASGAESVRLSNSAAVSGKTLNLQPGQQFKGTVVAVDGDKVSIQTEDHVVFSARLEGGVNVENGAVLSFEVKGVSGNQIALTPLYSNLQQDSSIIKALNAAEIPLTESNIRTVNEMMSQGMGIDKQSLQDMFRLIEQYKSADPVSLVQMKQMNLPISEDNIGQFESYRNNTAQILNGYHEIGDQFRSLMQDMAAQKDYEGLGRIFLEIMKTFSEEALPEAALSDHEIGNPDALPVGEAGQPGTGNPDSVAGNEQAGQAQAGGDMTGAGIGTTAGNGMENIAESTAENSGIGKDVQLSGSPGHAPGPSGPVSAVDALLEALRQAEQAEKADAAVQGHTLQEQGIQERTMQNPVAGESVTAAVDAEAQLQDLLQNFLPGLADADGAEAAALYQQAGQKLAELLQDTAFGAALEKKLTKGWLMKPEEVAQKEQVQALYEKVLRQTADLERILTDAGKNDTEVTKSIQNMTKNVEFLNELNQNFSYVQLPLRMSEHNAHGELYVYTNKRNLSAREGAVTALLHLAMDHLGDMDIYVALQNQRVSTKFYLENEDVIDFLEAHMKELDGRLAKKGYALHTELLHKDHKDSGNVFEQMLSEGKGVGRAPMVMMSRQSFDVRA